VCQCVLCALGAVFVRALRRARMHGRQRPSAAAAAAAKAADAPRIEAYRALTAAIHALVRTRPTRRAARMSAQTAVHGADPPARRATRGGDRPPQRSAGATTDEALELTAKAIGQNPDLYSMWNYRREILEKRLPELYVGRGPTHARRLVAAIAAAWRP